MQGLLQLVMWICQGFILLPNSVKQVKALMSACFVTHLS